MNVDYTIQRMQGTSHVYIPCLCYSVDEGIDHSWIYYLHGMISPTLKPIIILNIDNILHLSNVYFFCILQFGDDEDEVATLSKHHL